MGPLMDALVAQLLVPILLALAAGAGAWITTRLPGPLRDWLASGTHQRDIELITGVMLRRALAQATSVKTASGPLDVIAYAKAQLPETLDKLAVSDEALTTMAQAAVQKALAERALITAGAAP